MALMIPNNIVAKNKDIIKLLWLILNLLIIIISQKFYDTIFRIVLIVIYNYRLYVKNNIIIKDMYILFFYISNNNSLNWEH